MNENLNSRPFEVSTNGYKLDIKSDEYNNVDGDDVQSSSSSVSSSSQSPQSSSDIGLPSSST